MDLVYGGVRGALKGSRHGRAFFLYISFVIRLRLSAQPFGVDASRV